MENCRFVSYSELRDYFKKGLLKEDIETLSALGICSIADLLFLTEDHKKKNLKIKSIEESFNSFIDGPYASGQIFTAELTREKLSEALFEKLEDDMELWGTAADKTLSPRDSITFLVLKATANTWWSENIFNEMYRLWDGQ